VRSKLECVCVVWDDRLRGGVVRIVFVGWRMWVMCDVMFGCGDGGAVSSCDSVVVVMMW
jgi:hypothetical protein